MRISITALEQFIRCPHQYHQERHLKNKGEPGQGMLMGRVIHRTIDKLLKQHIENAIADYINLGDAAEIYSQEWTAETGLHDKEKFTVGLQQIHDWIENVGVVNPAAILETEKWFSFQIEDDLEIVGIIDLILENEILNDKTGEILTNIEVVDWKTSLAFTAPSEAHDSLQLSVYIMAAKQLYPQANVKAALHMLSEGIHLPTGRTDRDLAQDYMFIRSMAKRIEKEEKWAPILNPNCIYCHVKSTCAAYKEALHGPMPTVVEDLEDLEALAVEREALVIREKIAKRRKDQISTILKIHLRSMEGPLELGDYIYKLSQSPRKSYPILETVQLLSKRLHMSPNDVLQQICTVSNTKLNELIKGNQTSEARMASAALANIAQTTYTSRLSPPKKIKPHKKEKNRSTTPTNP